MIDGYRLKRSQPIWVSKRTPFINGSIEGTCLPTRLEDYGNSERKRLTIGSIAEGPVEIKTKGINLGGMNNDIKCGSKCLT